MHLIICDLSEDFIREARRAFGDFEDVEFLCEDFQKTDGADVLVSAANSFGIMDGGIDLAISKYFGWELEREVQKHIVREYLGQQPIGTAFLIPVSDDRFSFLCHSPTMRVPENIEGTENAYTAMQAILRECHHAEVETVMCCGLGTGVGELDMATAADQMALAYSHYKMRRKNIDWDYAKRVQEDIQRTLL